MKIIKAQMELLIVFLMCLYSCTLKADTGYDDNSMQSTSFNYHKAYFDKHVKHIELMGFFIPDLIDKYPGVDFNERFLPFGLVWTLRAPVEVRVLDDVRQVKCELTDAQRKHVQSEKYDCLIVESKNAVMRFGSKSFRS